MAEPQEPAAPARRGIAWDEETIAEHDKQRGNKMKIDEPKTPYEYMNEEDLVREEAEEQARLEEEEE
jgi:protein phosphatase inhibitor 2